MILIALLGTLMVACAKPLARHAELSGSILAGVEDEGLPTVPNLGILWYMRMGGIAIMAAGLLLI